MKQDRQTYMFEVRNLVRGLKLFSFFEILTSFRHFPLRRFTKEVHNETRRTNLYV